MKKVAQKIIFASVLVAVTIGLAGCQDIRLYFKGFEESFKGLEMTIQTYDEDSQVIDQITGRSVMIERDATFDSDTESKDSSVIKISVGSNEIHHVGSSMIIAESQLENVFEEYAKTVESHSHSSRKISKQRAFCAFVFDI